MATPSFESKFHVTASGTKTHYLQTGDQNGKLIICLHGLGGSVNTFKSLIPSLPETYNIVLVDFQGFGETPLTSATKPLSISDHVSDVDDLVAFLQSDSNGNAKGGKV
jgi:pimeloyl-ACP methyl ester carboxylesterase